MSRLILFCISLFLIIIVFEECTISKKSKSSKDSYSEINLLAFYGNEIYNRESCSNCHTQQIEEENLELVSLDGVGGKYLNDWHYYYLFKPQLTIPNSRKPSFSYLYSEPLDKEILLKIVDDKDLKTNKDTLWNQLISQADIISMELNRRGITAYNSAVVALISWFEPVIFSVSFRKIVATSGAFAAFLYISFVVSKWFMVSFLIFKYQSTNLK